MIAKKKIHYCSICVSANWNKKKKNVILVSLDRMALCWLQARYPKKILIYFWLKRNNLQKQNEKTFLRKQYAKKKANFAVKNSIHGTSRTKETPARTRTVQKRMYASEDPVWSLNLINDKSLEDNGVEKACRYSVVTLKSKKHCS